MNDTKKFNIKGIIGEKLPKIDKRNQDYLILKLENGETIFVFSSNVIAERWEGLREGDKEYNFTVHEGNNGSKILDDFEIET